VTVTVLVFGVEVWVLVDADDDVVEVVLVDDVVPPVGGLVTVVVDTDVLAAGVPITVHAMRGAESALATESAASCITSAVPLER
jgi:hypothetical protein